MIFKTDYKLENFILNTKWCDLPEEVQDRMRSLMHFFRKREFAGLRFIPKTAQKSYLTTMSQRAKRTKISELTGLPRNFAVLQDPSLKTAVQTKS